MNQVTFLILIINLVLVGLLGWGLVKLQARLLKRKIPDTYQKLYPEKWILFMALAAFWVGLVFLVSLLLSQTEVRPVSPSDQTKMGVFALLFFLMSARVFQSYFCLMGVAPHAIAWWTPGRARKPAIEVAWKDVARVEASVVTNRFIIRTRTGPRFGNFFLGKQMPALIAAFEQHLAKGVQTERATLIFKRLARFDRTGKR